MCTLQDFCCCCSLSTGVMFISIINLLFSFFPYLYGTESDLVKQSSVKLHDHTIHDLSCFYYGITATVSVSALFSVLSSNRWLLLPLQLWDFFRLGVIVEIIIRTISKGHPNSPYVWIIVALLLYCISAEYSYHKELLDGRPLDSMILGPSTTVTVCTATVPSAPPSLAVGHHQFMSPSAVVSMPEEYSVQNPYAKNYPSYQPQPPYPVSAPGAQGYPQQQQPPYVAGASAPPLVPVSVFANAPSHSVGASSFSQVAPPPYPVAQCNASLEKPPPYVP